jgi:hypothetical protein
MYPRLKTTVIDSRLTDGSKVTGYMSWSYFTPQNDSWYPLLLKAE